jgi:signal transduction histidine kinase
MINGISVVRDPGLRSESELREHFAALIRADCDAILTSFAVTLSDPQSPVSADASACQHALASAAMILAEIVARVQGGDTSAGDRNEILSWLIGAPRAESELSPADTLGTAVSLFNATVSVLARHVAKDSEFLPYFVTALLALNESISRRVREAMSTYSGYLLECVEQAHVDERLRVSRELHDRLGEGLSVALRQLELHEISGQHDPLTSVPRTAIAKDALTETMSRLRDMTSDLRQATVRNMEVALVGYLDSIAADAEVRLRVSGDEAWAPSAVIDEAYLIIREALRNALTHSNAKLVLIGITIAPHELDAWVEDDGRGFAVASSSAGTGIAAMRERAVSINGRLTLVSVPGEGTHMGLRVTLTGHCDDRSG